MKNGIIFGFLLLRAFSVHADPISIYNEIQVPKSQIEIAPNIPQLPETPPHWLEFGGSTWLPSNFVLPSMVSGAGKFESTGTPSLFMKYSFPMSKIFKAVTGLSFLSLDRSASVVSGPVNTNETQTLLLVSPRFGVEYTPERWKHTLLSPYLGLLALPTFAILGRSALDQGSTQFGVPVEWSLGSKVNLNFLGAFFTGHELDLSFVQTNGSVGSGKLDGTGFNVGLGIKL